MRNQQDHPSADTRALLRRLFGALDYAALASVYCEEGGEAFWAEHREPARDLGLSWAGALAARLRVGGSSLYVGAGVAELAALVTEVVDLSRQVRACNLEVVECAALNASLEGLGGATAGLRLHHGDALALLAADPGWRYDHLSVVSVLNDPGTFPLVSGVAYGRISPVLLDVEGFCRQRTAVRGLVRSLLAGLTLPATITTTVEEVAWFLDAAAELGLSIEADDLVLPTAIVGDPLGFLRVT